MNKKYYADITLYDTKKLYTIVGDIGTKKQELIEYVEQFAKRHKYSLNKITKKIFQDDKEIGEYKISSTNF